MAPALMLTIAACAATTLSALLFYAASPHQQAGRLPLGPGLAIWLGGALLVVAVGLMLAWSGWAVAVLTPLTVLMVVWSIVPLAIGCWRHRQEEEA